MNNYEAYEEMIKQIQAENEHYLDVFYNWLEGKGLGNKTINKHISNADLYLNYYLNYYDATKMEQGVGMLDMFFRDWFPRKCMWASFNAIKENIASLKKFYSCMLEFNYISQDDYNLLNEIIKENKKGWFISIQKEEAILWQLLD